MARGEVAPDKGECDAGNEQHDQRNEKNLPVVAAVVPAQITDHDIGLIVRRRKSEMPFAYG